MRAIYEPRGRAREYAELACNLFTGCAHGCRYCYAPRIARKDAATWAAEAAPRDGILEALKRDAAKLTAAGDSREILFCFTCDPFQSWRAKSLTEWALVTCGNYDRRSTVLTKGRCIDEYTMEVMEYYDVAFGTTITFLDDGDRQEWEPNASSVTERIDFLREMRRRGLRTWVSLEPVIDPAQSLAAIDMLQSQVEHWKVGKLNHNRAVEATIDWPQFRADVTATLESYGADYFIKQDLLEAGS